VVRDRYLISCTVVLTSTSLPSRIPVLVTNQFRGTDEAIRDLIGNAVPVNLAHAIGRSVMNSIRERAIRRQSIF